MRVGVTSPVVTALPGFFGPWEPAAGIAELGAIAEAADRLGFDHLTCSEHVAVPVPIAAERGGRYWDPLATLGYLAARTTRIRLATQVLVLGYHHPLEIAKRYGTLDLVSGGRLVLGLGVGSIEEEFDLLGADYAARGAIADDALPALRAALSTRTPVYDGPRYSFSDVVVEPHASQDRVPFWIGGHTARSLRRAREHGDGWVPFGLPRDRLRGMLAQAALPDGFEVVLGAGRPVDPLGEPDRTVEALERTIAAGATVVNVHVAATTADHYVEQLAALASLADLTPQEEK
ncbi:TIGR03619 family F420-dependent LLM class oxidoreductase [Nocardioides sp. zg-579]|uniref:TIGR03619 family F420-dependent LLM class oxidoreductase n=1 Tax=Nocardioides marmotae TaxID=2663857 RepID=A0A6I3JA41_9ACTN|nr:LLM class F420-dependent oxidoreductase [Nocardioides marmotae]MCR6031220.1 TIGR03619 family F420-dependent LLM class oxidoreductase [Gordonia jinghuaiqii]MTB94858.1 TIGR03619 family F420-dependent LLM class oxidoreductase [Nocardioides marmotae]QKE01160.1 LLM class F420-dependent oxidoreductase [Nocardioides marmotae]